MTRRRIQKPPLTEAQIWQADCRVVKVRDLKAITGLSDFLIREDIRSGRLEATQHFSGRNACYLIQPADAQAYLEALGFHNKRSA